METHSDFSELLALLNANSVEYVIVGAHALAFHGAPRYTGDLDIYVRPAAHNARHVMAALRQFGFGELDVSVEDFTEPGKVVQLGYPPVRIDLLTSLSGVGWEQVAQGSVPAAFGDIPVRYIGRVEYIANKKATGRMKDLADIEALGE